MTNSSCFTRLVKEISVEYKISVLCFVDRASVNKLANRTNLVHKFSQYVYCLSLHVQDNYVPIVCGCVIPPLETPPPRRSEWGSSLPAIVLSPEEASHLMGNSYHLFFTERGCQHLVQPPSWRATPRQLSAAAYSIYSQLPSILEAVPPSTTRGRAMPW